MALDASDEHGQGRTLEGGTGFTAEEIAGALYVRLEAGAGLAWISAGRNSVSQRGTIRIGVIADTHGSSSPAA
jgi:hypothetical protein